MLIAKPRVQRFAFARWLALLAVILPLGSLAGAAQADTAGAEAFLEQLNLTVERDLTDDSVGEAERERRFREMFNQNFDLPTIGRFVTGRYWRRAPDEDRSAFLQVFEDAMVQRFLPLFLSYEREQFVVVRSRQDARRERLVVVSSVIKRPEREDLSVDWRIVQNGGFKIVDILAEGVSMAIALRSEYVSVIRLNSGQLSALTEQLRAKVDAGAFEPDRAVGG